MSDAYLAFTADSAQQHNVGGGSWIIKINTEHFIKPWPAAGDIVGGVIVNMPLLRVDAPLARITPVPGTLYYKDSLVGRYGHQRYTHELGYEVANDTADINLELEKDINSTAVFIIGKADGTMRVLGKSSAGLQINNDSDSGVEGGENKTTVKAISNVQTRKKLVLSPTLEAQILSGNDGYGLTRISPVFPFLARGTASTANVVTKTLTLLGNTGLAGRKFAVNNLIKLVRINVTPYYDNSLGGAIPSITSFALRPESEGYITAKVISVQNLSGWPPPYVDTITIDEQFAINCTPGVNGVVSVANGNVTVSGQFAVQKL